MCRKKVLKKVVYSSFHSPWRLFGRRTGYEKWHAEATLRVNICVCDSGPATSRLSRAKAGETPYNDRGPPKASTTKSAGKRADGRVNSPGHGKNVEDEFRGETKWAIRG